ncbi:NAD(P)-binding protein [Microstroma glucosiphilum]|uniref:NAD(P)-binding protein n=1 Tax=Pseudomicrostroma glucosiphilum TaxID=1684307 RepID=A0A316U0K9_9BASI|nr:NAD(P)-binding protein [Pseudomicrostroma glucosiphilum]PWN18942.1 NAD(P)-binding protein [Pseudomicrostroma glucosiphilum]
MAALSASAAAADGKPLRPIILVTGANSGVGFATCQRLLLQLSSPLPSDTLPVHPAKRTIDDALLPTPFQASAGCTLLLACRNPHRAQDARDALLAILDRLSRLPDEKGTPTSVMELEKWGVSQPGALGTLRGKETEEVMDAQPDGDKTSSSTGLRTEPQDLRRREQANEGAEFEPRLLDDVEKRDARARGEYRRRFCEGTKVEIVQLDLGSLDSVHGCARRLKAQQPYLTHLILNAGGGAFDGINWIMATWMMLTQLRAALTRPRYKMQHNGDISEDGLGWVWQINIGGSWALTQDLLPLMRKSPYSVPSRVIFTSSVEAVQEYYDPADFQCLRTDVPSHSYESTKYQCDLAAIALEEQLANEKEAGTDATKRWTQPDVFATHPGVVATSIMADFLNIVTATAMLWSFYLARWLGSPHHCVAPYKGSLAHTYTALAPRTQFLQPKKGSPSSSSTEKAENTLSATSTATIRYAAQCDIWGREYVGRDRMDGWGPEGRGSTGGQEVKRLAREWRSMAEKALAAVGQRNGSGATEEVKVATGSEIGNGNGNGNGNGEAQSSSEGEEWHKVERAL